MGPLTGRRPATRRRWRWLTATEPFSALDDPAAPARFVVEQIGNAEFAIPPGLGFQYNPDGDDPIRVTAQSLGHTDFASIPRYMSWLVSRHGRHTPAALVHDQLVAPGVTFEDRKRADRRFLVMLDRLEVPPVLSRVMYAAVTLGTRWTGTRRSRLALMAWGLSAAGGIALFAVGVAQRSPGKVVVALVGPAVACLLWGEQWMAGLVAGYALPVVFVPAFTSLVFYWIYWLIEAAVRVVRQRGADKELPTPVPYQGR